jgi:hypothetical protein
VLRLKNPALAATLVVRTYRYNTIALLGDPLPPNERDEFVDELARMIVGYLS